MSEVKPECIEPLLLDEYDGSIGGQKVKVGFYSQISTGRYTS